VHAWRTSHAGTRRKTISVKLKAFSNAKLVWESRKNAIAGMGRDWFESDKGKGRTCKREGERKELRTTSSTTSRAEALARRAEMPILRQRVRSCLACSWRCGGRLRSTPAPPCTAIAQPPISLYFYPLCYDLFIVLCLCVELEEAGWCFYRQIWTWKCLSGVVKSGLGLREGKWYAVVSGAWYLLSLSWTTRIPYLLWRKERRVGWVRIPKLPLSCLCRMSQTSVSDAALFCPCFPLNSDRKGAKFNLFFSCFKLNIIYLIPPLPLSLYLYCFK